MILNGITVAGTRNNTRRVTIASATDREERNHHLGVTLRALVLFPDPESVIAPVLPFPILLKNVPAHSFLGNRSVVGWTSSGNSPTIPECGHNVLENNSHVPLLQF